MKRYIALILTLILAAGALPAFAAGSIEPTEETWYVVSHSDDYRVYYYAVVTNGGEKTVSVNDLLFEIQDNEGTTLESTSKYKLYPEILKPGESGWLVISKDVKDLNSKSDIDHYTLTITTKANDDKEVRPLTASAEYLMKDEDDNEDVMRATVANDGTENAFGITVAMAARDAQGKLLYIASDTTKDIGLANGGALLVRSLINASVMDELDKEQTEVASVEAIAYTVEDTDD